MRKTMSAVVLAAVLALAVAAPVAAQGFYIGVMAPRLSFAGHFDGDHFFETGEDFIYVPKMSPAWGWGVMAGTATAESLDLEFYYFHTTHDYTFLDVADTATVSAIGMNARWYLIPRGFLRPYGNFGIDFTFLTAHRGSMTAFEPYREGDARFNGIGLIGGAGLAVAPVRQLILFFGAELRWNLFGKAKGVSGTWEDLKELSSLALCLRSGLRVGL